MEYEEDMIKSKLTNRQAVEHLGNRLGLKVSEAAMRQWQRRGKLPASKRGHRTLVDPFDLEVAVAGHGKSSTWKTTA